MVIPLYTYEDGEDVRVVAQVRNRGQGGGRGWVCNRLAALGHGINGSLSCWRRRRQLRHGTHVGSFRSETACSSCGARALAPA